MATYTEIVESSEARARPILGEVCAQIADVQVRNRGTIGGNVCTNDPTNHLPPLLAALGAQFTIAGAGGERTVSRGRLLPRRLPDRRRHRRAADEDHDPGRPRRRLRRRHARRRRHVHRQRRRVDERQRDASRSAASTPCRSCSTPASADADAVRAAVARREPRPAVRRPRLERVPHAPRRGARRPRRRPSPKNRS